MDSQTKIRKKIETKYQKEMKEKLKKRKELLHVEFFIHTLFSSYPNKLYTRETQTTKHFQYIIERLCRSLKFQITAIFVLGYLNMCMFKLVTTQT